MSLPLSSSDWRFVEDRCSEIIDWAYDAHGDGRDFGVPDPAGWDRAGDIEEAANVVIEATHDGDEGRYDRAMRYLEANTDGHARRQVERIRGRVGR